MKDFIFFLSACMLVYAVFNVVTFFVESLSSVVLGLITIVLNLFLTAILNNFFKVHLSVAFYWTVLVFLILGVIGGFITLIRGLTSVDPEK